MVISARNPVHSVLFLILAFFNSAGLFVLMGAEFLAMILVVVYVGAVAVLFLFVVMMLDINFTAARRLPAIPADRRVDRPGAAGRARWSSAPGRLSRRVPRRGSRADARHRQVTNTEALGQLLYTNYIYLFQAAGMVLLVAMIGAIVLTHRSARACAAEDQRAGRPRREDSIELKDVPSSRERRLMLEIGLSHYLTVAAILFTLGIFGIFLNRKNVIIILMSIELMLLAVNINLVAFSTHLQRPGGPGLRHVRATVAAAEAAIGLAILVVYFRNRGSIEVEDING